MKPIFLKPKLKQPDFFGKKLIVLSAIAVIDRLGFTPGLAEMIDPFITYICSYPKT